MKLKLKQSSNKTSPFINYPNFQVKAREQKDSFIDWSANTPQTIYTPYVPPLEHVSSPHVPLSQDSLRNSNMSEMSSFKPSLLNYGNGQLTDTSFWDGASYVVSLFETKEALSTDAANIHESLVKIRNYIKNYSVGKEKSSPDFIPVVRSFWELFETIFATNWNALLFDRGNGLTIRKSVIKNIAPLLRKSTNLGSSNPSVEKPKEKSFPLIPTPTISSIPPSSLSMVILPTNNNNVLIKMKEPKPSNIRKSYAQVSKSNVLQIKKAFPSLSAGKVGKIIKAMNGSERKKKPNINMITRGLSRKQVIVLIAKSNAELIIHSVH